ncbi:unnamed protein product [Amoebophrya sp. A25]|nr:unnamed protein product [Amoebophrya sp. A25]|eukprot:GSA25T00011942001.1
MEHDSLIVKGNRLLFDRRKKEKEAGGDGAGAVRLDDLFQFLVPLIHYLVGLISCAYYLVLWLYHPTIILILFGSKHEDERVLLMDRIKTDNSGII